MINHDSPRLSFPVVESLINLFGDWLEHRREVNEMHQLPGSDFDRIAQELGVSTSDLEELVNRGPHAADEMPRLLAALGIDEAVLERCQPLVLHDMERVCAMCQSKGECDFHLATGDIADHYRKFCLNTETLEALKTTGRT